MSDSEPLVGEIVPAHEMWNQPRVSDAEIYQALEENEGNIAQTARQLGLRRKTLVERIDRRPQLIELMDELREEIVDIAESNTFKRARSGADPNAERFILQTLGKRRGWNTATGGVNNNGDITITITKFAEDGDVS